MVIFLKLSAISADKAKDKNQPVLYAKTYMDLGILRIVRSTTISYHGHIESRMLQTITRNVAMESAQVRQELYLRRKYEKAQQDVGLFYCIKFIMGYLILI